MVTVTDMLGVFPFGQSRIIINTNINALADEINNFETAFGISIASGNLDVSSATGGVIKAKQYLGNYLQFPVSGPASIVLDGTTGNISGANVTASTSITVPLLTVTNLVGAISGSATFNSPSSFIDLAEFLGGYSRGVALDLGTITSHTVLNSDNILIFDAAVAQAVTLTPDVQLVDGHEITLIYKGSNAGVNIPSTSLVGSLTATFGTGGYASSVTLVYQLSSGLWLVTGLVNATLA